MQSIIFKTKEEKFIYFFERMNIDMIDECLDDKPYQDFEKNVFLNLLKKAFNQFKKSGDIKLVAVKGKCIGCDKRKRGLSFIGNKSSKHLDLIIIRRNGKVKDIHECTNFKCERKSIKRKEKYLLIMI